MVCCFGSLNIDSVYAVPHIVRPGETLQSASLAVHAGGKGLNQSVALARASVSVRHAGKIGEDGRFLLALLREAGVDTSLITVTGTARTGCAMIQVDPAGQNSILLFGGANQSVTRADASSVFSALSPGDLVLLQNELNGTGDWIHAARERGLKVALNASPVTQEALRFPYEEVDTLFVNETEAAALCGVSGEDKMLRCLAQLCPHTVVLTLGELGARVISRGQVHSCGIVPVRPVDTTGAEDTYTGYFLAEMLGSGSIDAAMRIAAAASALAVTRPGAAESIPSRGEAEAFLNRAPWAGVSGQG